MHIADGGAAHRLGTPVLRDAKPAAFLFPDRKRGPRTDSVMPRDMGAIPSRGQPESQMKYYGKLFRFRIVSIVE